MLTRKTYQWARIIVTFFLAIAVAFGVIKNNYLIPLLAIGIAVTVFYIVKTRNKDVLQDERSYRIASAAARAAIGVFAIVAVVISFALLSLGSSELTRAVGETLAYSTNVLLILYLIFYKFYSGKM